MDGSYIYKPEDFRFMDGIFDFCRAAQEKGYLLIVATNQSGIARGYYSEEDFLSLTEWMLERFREQEIEIQKVYYCPYHPTKGTGKYRAESHDRKPNPGMLERAAREFDIDLAASLVLGDKDSDMLAGRAAGVGKLILFPGRYTCTDFADVSVVGSLSEVKKFL